MGGRISSVVNKIHSPAFPPKRFSAHSKALNSTLTIKGGHLTGLVLRRSYTKFWGGNYLQ
jgi:hypothetical protein